MSQIRQTMIDQGDCENDCNASVKVKLSNKCYQCEYASPRASITRMHMMIHSGEKSNKCNQCEYESSPAVDLRGPMRRHSMGNVMVIFSQILFHHVVDAANHCLWAHTFKSKTNASNVSMNLSKQLI